MIFHLSDIHLDQKRYISDLIITLFWFVGEVEREQPELICITGDLYGFDTNHRSTPYERSIMHSFLQRLGDVCPVVCIRGNHDAEGEIAGFSGLKSRYQIYGIENPTVIQLGNFSISCVPWMPKRKFNDRTLYDVIQSLKCENDYTICLSHYAAEGYQAGDFEIQTGRDQYITHELVDYLSLHYHYTGLGHLHRGGQLGQSVYYAGSFVPVTFGESWTHGYYQIDEYGVHLHKSKFPDVVTIRGKFDDRDILEAEVDKYVDHLVKIDIESSRLTTKDIRFDNENIRSVLVRPIQTQRANQPIRIYEQPQQRIFNVIGQQQRLTRLFERLLAGELI